MICFPTTQVYIMYLLPKYCCKLLVSENDNDWMSIFNSRVKFGKGKFIIMLHLTFGMKKIDLFWNDSVRMERSNWLDEVIFIRSFPMETKNVHKHCHVSKKKNEWSLSLSVAQYFTNMWNFKFLKDIILKSIILWGKKFL